jgi:methylated-DNA-protein-cysteine methyltransferase-like protein
MSPHRQTCSITEPDSPSGYAPVHAAVRGIPPGRVSTYGRIAALIGRPRAARFVGYAMHRCPPGLPWHRVINAQGRISLPADSTAGIAQRRRLEAEGIVFIGARIDLDRYAWPDKRA